MYQEFNKMFDTSAWAKAWDMESWSKSWNMDGLSESQKKGWEAARKAGDIWAERGNAIATRQMEMLQEAMDENIEAMRKLSTARGLEDYSSKQSEILRKQAEKATENAREVFNMATKVNADVAKLMKDQISEMMRVSAASVNKTAAPTKK